MNHRIGTPARALAAALLLAPSAGWAATLVNPLAPPAPGAQLPRLQPFVGFTQFYDSNIYLQPQSSPGEPIAGSWIEQTDAGLRLPIATADNENRLNLFYEGTYRAYMTEPSVNNALNHDVEGSYAYSGPSGFSAGADDEFLNTVDPADSELIARQRRWTNTLNGQLAYSPPETRLSLAVDGQQMRNKYVGDDPADPTTAQDLDRYEQLLGMKLGWQLLPKTVLYLAYHRQIIHFTDAPVPDRNSKGNLVDLGIDGDVTDKITGHAQVGFIDRSYDQTPGPGLSARTDDLTSEISLTYSPLERSRVDWIFSRQLVESAYGINQYFLATGTSLSFTQAFPWGLTARVYEGVEWDQYPDAVAISVTPVYRRDDNYQSGVNAEYPFNSWLKGGAGFIYRARFSRDESAQFNFRDEITDVSLTATF